MGRRGTRSGTPSRSPAAEQASDASAPMMRVLLHTHSWSHCDGVAIRYKAHTRQLRAEGHWVGLVISADESDSAAEAAATRLLTLPDAARVPMSDGPEMPMGSVRNFWAALRFVNREQPDVIHATFDSHAVSWLLVARLTDTALVMAYHADTMVRQPAPPLLQLLQLLLLLLLLCRWLLAAAAAGASCCAALPAGIPSKFTRVYITCTNSFVNVTAAAVDAGVHGAAQGAYSVTAAPFRCRGGGWSAR